MSRKRVAIDIDGVMADFCGGFTEVAVSLGIIPHGWKTSQQVKWDFDFPVHKVWEELSGNRMNWWMRLMPLVNDEEIDIINDLIRNHDVFFVTNRTPVRGLASNDQTRLWLEGIGLRTERVFVTDDKAYVCKLFNIEYVLEDKPANLQAIEEAGIPHVYARRWDYNKQWEPYVENLVEFCEIVDKG
mgnify:CR=1 FL=1